MNMQKITIRNFGPITNAEIEIKKTIVLIGEQASGKSTIIKLISSFTWLEKDLYRSSVTKEVSGFDTYFGKNVKNMLSYHRIESYFNHDTVIEYQGLAYNFSFSNNELKIVERGKDFIYPQIIYIPAERNFISYVNNFKAGEFIPWGLKDFIDDFRLATTNLKQPLKLPVNNVEIINEGLDILSLKENGKYNIKLADASSGFQAIVPILLVSEYLLNKIHVDNSREKNSLLKKNSLINIVEEPEQNLFPVSQMQLVKSLVSICNTNINNKLIISTHSPYVLATINNLILANKAGGKNPQKVVSKVDRQFWLNINNVFAGIVKDGTVEQIVDKEFDMISVEQIDSVSRDINAEFDFLYNLETEENAEL
jgi:predicted ATP-binding protein involved in virulence